MNYQYIKEYIKEEKEKMDELVEYILDKIKQDYFIILGTNDIIDRFSSNFNIDMSILMAEHQDGKSEQFTMFNKNTNEIVIVAITKKDDVIPILKIIIKSKIKNTDFDDIIGLEFEDEGGIKGHIYPIIAKTDEDKIGQIQKIFRYPKESEIEKVNLIIRDKIKKIKDDTNIGYA